MTNLFEAPKTPSAANNDPTKTYYDERVGEGKKFRDNEALARAKAESDAFIARLQEEMAGLRQDLNTRLTMEQLMDKIAAKPNEAPPTQSPNQQTPNSEVKSTSPDDIERIIEDRLSKAERTRVQNANLALVRESLEQNWGQDYVQRLKEKASDLGVGEEFLQGLAKDQPKAFLKLVEADTPASKPAQTNNTLFVPPTGQNVPRQANGFSPTGQRTKAFYDQIKAKNPSEYWSPSVQNQMHNDAIKLGEAFFDN